MNPIDFGSLSEDETATIAIEALSNLSVDRRIELVKQLFRNADDRAELIAQLED